MLSKRATSHTKIIAFLADKTTRHDAERRALQRTEETEDSSVAEEFGISFGLLLGAALLFMCICLCLRWVKGDIVTKKERSNFFAYQKARGAKMPRATEKVAPEDNLEAGFQSSARSVNVRNRSQTKLRSASSDPIALKSTANANNQDFSRAKTSDLSTPNKDTTPRVGGAFSRAKSAAEIGSEQIPRSHGGNLSGVPGTKSKKVAVSMDAKNVKTKQPQDPGGKKGKGKGKPGDLPPSPPQVDAGGKKGKGKGKKGGDLSPSSPKKEPAAMKVGKSKPPSA
eukprot:GEMP01026418.1.p1 GENE.GEMP01026418.1~~GEMP01026418.1.p1  ORF type:complete len:282 (+),score=59.28 GEMP01026418.1:184-1029(+)